MKKILIFALFLVFMGCNTCVKYPERHVGKDGVSMEPDSCYDYRICLYYVVMGKLQSNCNQEFQKCCKDRDYDFCKGKTEKWTNDAQNCWDKKQ